MNSIIILELVLLFVMLMIGGGLVYLIFKVGQIYGEQKEPFNRMVDALEELSKFSSEFRSMPSIPGDSEGAALERIVERFDAAVLRFSSVLSDASQQITQTQQEFLHRLASHLDSQQATLEELIRSLQVAVSVQSSQRLEPRGVPQRGDVSQEVSREPGHLARDAAQRFTRLSEWLQINIQSVMKRSFGQWGQPEDLLFDAPHDLMLTAQVLDGKVLLVGTRGHAKQLALVLPGNYIGTRYYDWFILPKGTNERVEGTIKPAIVEQTDSGFRVIQRGTVKQD
jgi:hypothetical protein